MSKLMEELKSIFEEGEKEYEVKVKKRVDEYYKIIRKALTEAVKDISKGLIHTYTYNLRQQIEEQLIEPFELIAEGIEEKFDNDGINVEVKVSYFSDDGTREAKFTFSGWD